MRHSSQSLDRSANPVGIKWNADWRPASSLVELNRKAPPNNDFILIADAENLQTLGDFAPNKLAGRRVSSRMGLAKKQIISS